MGWSFRSFAIGNRGNMRIQGAAKWKSRDRLFQVSEFEGRDVGTAMARALIDVARASEPSVMVTA